jgi:crossover junction endodeoxyribonuclease RuvC
MDRDPAICTVGIDLSLTATGFAVCISKGGKHKLKMQTVKTKPKDYKDDIERRESIVRYVRDQIPKNVNLVCIEDYYTPHNPSHIGAAIKLIEVGSLMRSVMWDAGIPFYIPTAQHIKKFATGKGNAPKELILREVYKRWQLDAKDNNQADAAVLALMAQLLFKTMRSLPRGNGWVAFQKEVVKKVLASRPHYNVD